MIFKKKRMIDIGELQRRGRIVSPQKEIDVPTNKDGFVEMNNENSSNKNFFGFETKSSTESFSTETNGYNKREVDEKIVNLDNKIYKLEQRVELLERKLDINQPNDNNSGSLIGW